jgi:uncharacterized protein YegL
MKENFTSINVVIDKSGSMGHLVSDTIGGFNRFLAEQKAEPGTASFSLCLFSVDNKLTHYNDINEVQDLNYETYAPGGGTALLDALGKTINEVGTKLAALPEEERPSKVVVVVITDGEENSSKEFTKSQIKEMISHQEEKYNWSFSFMGANMDSVKEGSTIGVRTANAVNYSASSKGTAKLYGTLSNSLRRVRAAGAGFASSAPLFTPEETKDLADSNNEIDIPIIVDPNKI